MISDEQKLAAVLAYIEEKESTYQIANRLKRIDSTFDYGLNYIDIMALKELFVLKGSRITKILLK